MSASHDELVAQFVGITGSTPAIAQSALTSTEWNLEEAVTVFYASQDQPEEGEAESESEQEQGSGDSGRLQQTTQPIPVHSPSSARTLGGAPPPASSTSSSTANRAPPSTLSNMRTIRDLQNQHDGDGSDSESDHEQDFFAGGEKSGLAVQNPNKAGASSDPFNDILNQAKRNAERPEGDDGSTPPQEAGRSSAFTGRAQTLGGDDAPSEVVEDPYAAASGSGSGAGASGSSLPRIERVLHLWQDGFSIDDGQLYRFDDPANAPTLALINQGRAPLALLGVQPGQEVDLKLDTHKNENYVAPKKKYKPFGGSGQRLGSPTPGVSAGGGGGAAAATAPASAAASSSSASASSSSASAQSIVKVDDSAPTVTLQIRLGDGTRLTSRFNTTHTVGDVYDFVQRTHAASSTRPYGLITIMPNKDLADKSVALADIPELKRGGVVVQKWT